MKKIEKIDMLDFRDELEIVTGEVDGLLLEITAKINELVDAIEEMRKTKESKTSGFAEL